jgi:hypothetical protein
MRAPKGVQSPTCARRGATPEAGAQDTRFRELRLYIVSPRPVLLAPRPRVGWRQRPPYRAVLGPVAAHAPPVLVPGYSGYCHPRGTTGGRAVHPSVARARLPTALPAALQTFAPPRLVRRVVLIQASPRRCARGWARIAARRRSRPAVNGARAARRSCATCAPPTGRRRRLLHHASSFQASATRKGWPQSSRDCLRPACKLHSSRPNRRPGTRPARKTGQQLPAQLQRAPATTTNSFGPQPRQPAARAAGARCWRTVLPSRAKHQMAWLGWWMGGCLAGELG